jgi:hypothetical protein
MELTMRQKQAVTKRLAQSYQKARKKEKGKILDGLIPLTSYQRSYAARVLRRSVRAKASAPPRRTRNRPRKYGQEIVAALSRIWAICNGICGKRLAPFLPEIIPVLEGCGELTLPPAVRQKLLQISPATLDRLLAPLRQRYQLRARGATKPGTLLKHQIPIRTFREWSEGRPGSKFLVTSKVYPNGGH